MIEIGLVKYFVIGFSILVISFLGIIVNRSNIIITFLSIEMMLLSINFIFIIYSRFLDDILGQVNALLFLTIGAAESAIGLGILIAFYRIRKDIFIYSSLLRS
jgi:NADH:ubiquinone oxidoreductase subunit K